MSNGPQRHETARTLPDTHPHPLGALRATSAFLAGVAVNVAATVCMDVITWRGGKS